MVRAVFALPIFRMCFDDVHIPSVFLRHLHDFLPIDVLRLPCIAPMDVAQVAHTRYMQA